MKPLEFPSRQHRQTPLQQVADSFLKHNLTKPGYNAIQKLSTAISIINLQPLNFRSSLTTINREELLSTYQLVTINIIIITIVIPTQRF